jgi:hypothetical protein
MPIEKAPPEKKIGKFMRARKMDYWNWRKKRENR